MPKKPSKPQVAESPIADVFENRHPSEAEKNWAEKTLAPTLEKSPERPIGAPTGLNLDEHGRARFTTISGVHYVLITGNKLRKEQPKGDLAVPSSQQR